MPDWSEFDAQIARSYIAARAIETKQLVRLFPKLHEPRAMAHYLVYAEANAQLPKIRKFKDWILSETPRERLPKAG